jgi:hypothetical protein
MVTFSGFGVEESEWVNALSCVQLRSFPFRASECEFLQLWPRILLQGIAILSPFYI